MTSERTHRAGASVEDHCRACKTDRLHTVIAADNEGRAIRVACGYCHSEHHYRGGPQVVAFGGHASAPRGPRVRGTSTAPFPIVSERERMAAPMTPVTPESDDLEFLLRRIIREEAGVTPATPEERWRGGTLVLRPGGAGGQEKSWPIETFFHKIVMVRNRLRTLEQQVNASDLPADVKVKMQGYVSGCYGSLTSPIRSREAEVRTTRRRRRASMCRTTRFAHRHRRRPRRQTPLAPHIVSRRAR